MTARGLCLALILLAVLGAACAPSASTPPSAPSKAPAPASGAATAPAASAAAAAPAAPTAVPAADPVRLGLIGPQAGYWAIYAAEAQGFFARERVANDVTYTRSPATSAQLLATGDVDLTVGTADTSAIAISKGADFVIVAGTQADALFTLIVQPSVQSYADLRGKLVAINNLRDGPTTMLRRLLRANNMREDDVEFIAVGGTPERFTALTSGNVAGAMLAQPQDLMAQASGHRRLAIATEILPDFQNFNVVANRPWARANDDRLVRWIRAVIAACAWLNDPANRGEAVRVLVDATQTPEDIAQRTWALYFEERAGKAIPPDGGINQAGLRNVLALADESGNFEGSPPPPIERLLDLSYWERARR
jgi:ABC-type nitrate/sulfonate/bicarbonate transport system substrate-binding protein